MFGRNRLIATYAYARFNQQPKQYKNNKQGTLPETYNDRDKRLNMVLKCLLLESNHNLSINDRYTKKSDIFNLKHTFFHIYEITVKHTRASVFILCPNLNKTTSELIRNLHVHLNKTKVQFYDKD